MKLRVLGKRIEDYKNKPAPKQVIHYKSYEILHILGN